MRTLGWLMLSACLLGRPAAAEQAIEPTETEPAPLEQKEYPRVKLHTSHGEILLELYPDKAPVTVANFLQYVADDFYNGTIFHRVIPDFMIQGGGFDADLNQRSTRPPIRNEADNGLSNKRGTMAMARTTVVDSATSQFFINLKDNDFLNHRDASPAGFGYCVFGRVVEGMDVVERIAAGPTMSRRGHANVPIEPVVIERAASAE